MVLSKLSFSNCSSISRFGLNFLFKYHSIAITLSEWLFLCRYSSIDYNYLQFSIFIFINIFYQNIKKIYLAVFDVFWCIYRYLNITSIDTKFIALKYAVRNQKDVSGLHWLIYITKICLFDWKLIWFHNDSLSIDQIKYLCVGPSKGRV